MMNRSTFLKRTLGAMAALFVPWKVGAGENITVDGSGPLSYGKPCPVCGDTGWTKYAPNCMCPDPYLPNYPNEVRRVPCQDCRPEDYASWDYRHGSSLLAHLEWERTKVITRGFEPRSFCCSEVTLKALKAELIWPGRTLDFNPEDCQAVTVMGLPWIGSASMPYGEFRVNGVLSARQVKENSQRDITEAGARYRKYGSESPWDIIGKP